jgi:hypothetical protein
VALFRNKQPIIWNLNQQWNKIKQLEQNQVVGTKSRTRLANATGWNEIKGLISKREH